MEVLDDQEPKQQGSRTDKSFPILVSVFSLLIGLICIDFNRETNITFESVALGAPFLIIAAVAAIKSVE